MAEVRWRELAPAARITGRSHQPVSKAQLSIDGERQKPDEVHVSTSHFGPESLMLSRLSRLQSMSHSEGLYPGIVLGPSLLRKNA